MREDDINLVQSQGPIKKTQKTFMGLGVGIFGFVFAVGAILLLYSLFLSSSSVTLANQIKDIRDQIAENAVKKQKMLITSERISAVKKILAERNGAERSASKIYSIFPSNFTVESLSSDGSQITVTVTSSNLADFASFLSTTVPDFIKENKGLASSVHIDTFSEDGGEYSLGLTFNTGGAVKK